MAKTFDATLKQLVDQFGADWTSFLAHHLGLPNGTRAEPLDADLSVASPQADKLLRLSGAAEGVLHLELESSWAGDIPGRLVVYSALAEQRHGGPVYSVVILLRPEANASTVTGELVRTGLTGEYLRFRYRVIRLWELPSAELWSGPVGILPLALLTNDAQANLDALIPEADERVSRELGKTPEGELVRTACLFLLGLRYDKEMLRQLFAGVSHMRESSAYEMILDEGAIRGKRDFLIRRARKRFGPPPADIEAAILAITDPDRLDRMFDAVDDVRSWNELLQT
jgi:predicted transposase YdaD